MNLYPNSPDDIINVALIEARKDIADPFTGIAKDCGIAPHTFVTPYADIATLALDIEAKVDAIMCRSGTAVHVARNVAIPVVEIPITSFDVMCAIRSLETKGDRVAVFCHRRAFAGMDIVEQMFDCSISQYVFTETDEIGNLVREAYASGARYCLGGAITRQYAHECDLKAILISPNEDTIFRSVLEALRVVHVRREERKQGAWLKVVFDSISEGVVATDNQDRVVIYNGAAERICKVDQSKVVGKSIREVVRDPGIAINFKAEEQETSYLKVISGKTYAFRKKPVLLDGEVIGTISTFEDITKIQHLEGLIRNHLHTKGLVPRYRFDDILARDKQMIECKKLAARYASTPASIVIEGESGTGKELFAHSIHSASDRAAGPFVAVNCAAIPETLLESELFGYEGGAFTGARKEGRPGLFEQAHKGTIFLDEIGEIPASLQARLLRVLQEREIRRVGGDKVFSVDIRIISATNKNLQQKVRDGLFRDDLFYRLNVLSLRLPPLRERREDIVLLAGDMLREFNLAPGPDVLAVIGPMLKAYDWPGNIRELRNIIQRLSLSVTGDCPPPLWGEVLQQALQVPVQQGGMLRLTVDTNLGLKNIVRQVEKEILDYMLETNEHDYSLVASKLKIGRTSAWRKNKGAVN